MKKTWFAIFLIISLLSCGKENLQSKLPAVNLPVVNNLPVTITLSQDKPGYKIPETFEGLSFETGILGDNPDFLNENNKVLIQLIKNLGSGILRIGGNSSDRTTWINGDRTVNTPKNSLTTSDIDRLSAFDGAIKWPVLFGLNLGVNNAAMASTEAWYVHKSLRDNLYAFQSGNEPDVYNLGLRSSKYNFSNYLQEWSNYFLSVRKEVPGAPFAGPDVTPFNSEWITLFANNESKNIKLIDGHYYVTGPATTTSIDYNNILTQNIKLTAYLGVLQTTSSKYHLPFRISECNSIFGGGKSGVSDVFASALWALDFMWQVAENKGQGVNFHSGGSFAYSPVGVDSGIYTARPEYYGMLAFKYGATGQTIIPVTVSNPGYNFNAYACTNSEGSYAITLINEDVASSFSFTIQFSKTASTARVARLTSPGITSTTGTVFAGSAVNADGTFNPNITEQYTIHQKSFVVTVPAGSAAVVTVQ